MLEKKLNIDYEKVKKARDLAKSISNKINKEYENYTTNSVERAVLRLFGVDFKDKNDVPVPNLIVDDLFDNNLLNNGAALHLVNALVKTNLTVEKLSKKIANHELKISDFKLEDFEKIQKLTDKLVNENLNKIEKNNKKRKELQEKTQKPEAPYLYLIVATGNIHEDVKQAVVAAEAGADIIAVIRTTGQSLLDFVPYGETTEGFGGTYATQANFKLMRKALDEVSLKLNRYVMLVNYCSGLCMPEIAAMGAIERLDMMLNDSMYGILFRDINLKRTFIDQNFSRRINAFADVIINTGEDNYLTTSDAYEEAHTVLASQFINEQFALFAGLKEEQIGLGHAFEMNPNITNGFLYEIASALLSREIFDKHPLKYMPPTKYKTGNIFFGFVQDAMFNFASSMTNQTIHLLGMLTEAIHTPYAQDRFLAVKNAKYIFNNIKDLSSDISFKPHGIVQSRANEVLNETVDFLQNIDEVGLKRAIADKYFASISRKEDGGKGLNGVIRKSEIYQNPFEIEMRKRMGR